MEFETHTTKYLFGLIQKETKTPINTTIRNVAKTTSKGNDSLIITQIVKEFQDRSRVDIQKWRQALQAAEDINNPKFAPLQDLYDNLMMDGHVQACIQIRKAATLSNRFVIKDKKTGQELPEKTDLLKTEWFYSHIDHLLDSIFLKYTVLELTDPVTFTWSLIPRRNVLPQYHQILLQVYDTSGIDYTLPQYQKNILDINNISKFGIINDIVPQLIWKRNAQQAWADFSERFGIPMVTAQTNKIDKKELDRIESMLRNLGQAAQAVLPEGTTITIHDSTSKGDPFNIFDKQISRANEEISKRILGGTMITDNGSSKSQSEVHERTFNDIIAESDRRTIEFYVNGKLIPLLRLWGVGFSDNDVFEFDRSEELSLKEHWDIVNQALAFYKIDAAWISSHFNIPITGEVSNTQTQKLQAPKASFSKNFH